MRKWIVTFLIVVAVVGTCGYLVSQPRRGTVEYHKAALKSARRPSLLERLIGKTPLRGMHDEWRSDQFRYHFRALVESGYLIEKQFLVTNVSAHIAAHELKVATWTDARFVDLREFLWIRSVSPVSMKVTGTSNLVEMWEQMLPKIDVVRTNY